MHAYLLSCEMRVHLLSNPYMYFVMSYLIWFPMVSHQLFLWATILSDKLIAPHILKKLSPSPPPTQRILNVSTVFEKVRDLCLS